jgi:hypothetical protein
VSREKFTNHGLQIHLGIPIRVEDNHNVSSGQVDAETSCSGRKHEKEFFAAGFIEFVNLALSVLVQGLSVETTVLKNITNEASGTKS